MTITFSEFFEQHDAKRKLCKRKRTAHHPKYTTSFVKHGRGSVHSCMYCWVWPTGVYWWYDCWEKQQNGCWSVQIYRFFCPYSARSCKTDRTVHSKQKKCAHPTASSSNSCFHLTISFRLNKWIKYSNPMCSRVHYSSFHETTSFQFCVWRLTSVCQIPVRIRRSNVFNAEVTATSCRRLGVLSGITRTVIFTLLIARLRIPVHDANTGNITQAL